MGRNKKAYNKKLFGKNFSVELKTYDNKSRQGKYWKIQAEGKPPRTYKFQGAPQELGALLSYYHSRYHEGKKTGTYHKYIQDFGFAFDEDRKSLTPDQRKVRVGNINKEAKRYIQKLKRQKEIKAYLQRGVGHATIGNIETTNYVELHKAKKQVLSKLVLDEEILELLARPENFNTLKLRLEYRATFHDNNGKPLLDASIFNKTLEETITLLRQTTTISNREVVEGSNQLTQHLKDNGFIVTPLNKGSHQKISLQIIFRKAK